MKIEFSKHIFKKNSQIWHLNMNIVQLFHSDGQTYRDAVKSLARPTSRCISFDVENISYDASLVICINSTNISPIIIINRVYETQNLLLL